MLTEHVEESETYESKSEFDGSEKAKLRLVKTIIAFANTEGVLFATNVCLVRCSIRHGSTTWSPSMPIRE